LIIHENAWSQSSPPPIKANPFVVAVVTSDALSGILQIL
jgi:hypothetical protein